MITLSVTSPTYYTCHILKPVVSWKGHIINVGSSKDIWQLESYSDVLSYKLSFYNLPHYRRLTHNYRRMQKPLLHEVRNTGMGRAPSWTEVCLLIHSTFHY